MSKDRLVIIPNTLEPYGQELVHIMFFPNGFRFRFRFKEEWLGSEVVYRIDMLDDMSGYIVLRDFESGKFIPIRKMKLISSQKIGNIFYFQTELSDFFDLESDDSQRLEQLKKFNEDFTQNTPISKNGNKPREHLNPLVFKTTQQFTLSNTTPHSASSPPGTEQWGNIIRELQILPFYDGVQFLYLAEVRTAQGITPKIEDGVWLLNTGEHYYLKLLQHVASSKPIKYEEVKLVADEFALRAIKASHHVVGKYDVLELSFSTNNLSTDVKSFIGIVQRNEGAVENRIFVDISIRAPRKKLYLSWAGLAISTVAYMSPSIIPLLDVYVNIGLTAELVKDLSLIGFTLSLVSISAVSNKDQK